MPHAAVGAAAKTDDLATVPLAPVVPDRPSLFPAVETPFGRDRLQMKVASGGRERRRRLLRRIGPPPLRRRQRRRLLARRGRSGGRPVLSPIPIAIGIAILRYGLFDIDRIIHRTLVYGALTATLGLAYVSVVTVLQRLSAPLTHDNSLAVAGSTLAVAALIGPARRRIQRFIDRRFYRSKFNAQKAIDDFSAQLREEVDSQALPPPPGRCRRSAEAGSQFPVASRRQ
jgi:hypothetical protein